MYSNLLDVFLIIFLVMSEQHPKAGCRIFVLVWVPLHLRSSLYRKWSHNWHICVRHHLVLFIIIYLFFDSLPKCVTALFMSRYLWSTTSVVKHDIVCQFEFDCHKYKSLTSSTIHRYMLLVIYYTSHIPQMYG